LFFYRERRSSGTHPAKALGPASERLGAVILAMIKTRCGFCESAIAKITNEHIYGKWVGALFGAGRGRLQVHHTLTREGDFARAWNAYRLDQQVRMACRACNNGWMNDLETKVRPIITPMIVPMVVGQQRVTLDLQSRLLVATWAVKTAMVGEFLAQPHQRYFMQDERRAVMEGEVFRVSGARVWIGCFANTNEGAKGIMGGLTHEDRVVAGHVTVFALGQFVVQVFVERRTAGYHGPLAVGPGPWERLLIEIWPPDMRSVNKEDLTVWPPPLAFADDDALGALFDRFFTFGTRPLPLSLR